MLENRSHLERMIDSEASRAAGSLFHLLREAQKAARKAAERPRQHKPLPKPVIHREWWAMSDREAAIRQEDFMREMEARRRFEDTAERSLWERQWG